MPFIFSYNANALCTENWNQKVQVAQGMTQSYFAASNHITEIYQDAQNLSQVSSSIAIASGSLMLSGSLAAYYFKLNPGLIGSIVTFLRLPQGAVGTVAALTVAELLKLNALSTGLYNSTVVALSVSSAHIESVYLIGRGIYELTSQSGELKVQVSLPEMKKDLKTIQNALLKTQFEIESHLNSEPSRLKNGLTLGGANVKHFARLAELAQTRALLSEQIYIYLKAQKNMAMAYCQ